MELKLNEFKISSLRQFGAGYGDNIAFVATIYTDKDFLSEEVIKKNIESIDFAQKEAFKKSDWRNITDKEILGKSADYRREEMVKLESVLKEEVLAKAKAEKTARFVEKISKEFKQN